MYGIQMVFDVAGLSREVGLKMNLEVPAINEHYGIKFRLC